MLAVAGAPPLSSPVCLFFMHLAQFYGIDIDTLRCEVTSTRVLYNRQDTPGRDMLEAIVQKARALKDIASRLLWPADIYLLGHTTSFGAIKARLTEDKRKPWWNQAHRALDVHFCLLRGDLPEVMDAYVQRFPGDTHHRELTVPYKGHELTMTLTLDDDHGMDSDKADYFMKWLTNTGRPLDTLQAAMIEADEGTASS
jgi:hypothetical protein